MDDSTWAVMMDYAGGGNSHLREDDPLVGMFQPLVQASRTNSGLVVGQLGQSLDGRIATESGHSRYINGHVALCHLHRLRALVQAVVIGAGTARADDPQLTVRHCTGPSPARVVIDPRGTIAPGARVWADDGTRQIVFGGRADLPRRVKRIAVPAAGFGPAFMLGALRDLGLVRVLVEGGAATVSQFVAAEALDALHLLVGPIIIGSGPAGLTLPRIETLRDAVRPTVATHVFAGGDVLFHCRFH